MTYVEKLEVEHVLAAITTLGWEPGKKPPSYVELQVKCRSMFGNGGDGNRIKSLRQQAIALALEKSGAPAICAANATPPPRLPEDLQAELDGLANDISKRLAAFDQATATYIERNRSDSDAAATARIIAVRKEAAEQAADCDDEINAALAAIECQKALVRCFEG